MKYYKLLHDLPTFNEGDLFVLKDNGSLYLESAKASGHWKNSVMAYHKMTLEKFPNILRDWFEEVECLHIPAVWREALQSWIDTNENPIVKISVICSEIRDSEGFYEYSFFGYISLGYEPRRNITAIQYQFRSKKFIAFDHSKDYALAELGLTPREDEE